jgi:hypothetical protein
LKTLRNVTSITANIYRLGDLEALSGMKSLTTLNLAMNAENISSLAPLKSLPQLATLNLDLSAQIDGKFNLDWLPELPHLTSLVLNIGGSSRITDVGAIAKLGNLLHLTLNVNSQIGDLVPLQGLKRLTTLNLDLAQNYKIGNLNALRSLPGLATLRLRLSPHTADGKAFDIGVLGDLTGVTNLDLDFIRIDGKITDSGVLARMGKLKAFSSHGSLNADGNLLSAFRALTRLDLRDSSLQARTLPENVTDLSMGSYATEDWGIQDSWQP